MTGTKDNEKRSASRDRTYQMLAFTGLVLASTACSWAISAAYPNTEEELIIRLLTAFGADELAVHVGRTAPVAILAETALIALITAAAFLAAYRLSPVAVAIAAIQLAAVSILWLLLLWHLAGVSGHVLAYLWALPGGLICGYASRQIKRAAERSRTRYYELLLRNKELLETRLQIVKQDEIERRMLAADLHDQVLNDLKAIKQALAGSPSSGDDDSREKMSGLLESAMNQIRAVMESLCPSTLEHLGLVAAIEDCLRRGSARSGFRLRFKNRLKTIDPGKLSMVEQSLLFRLVQETTTNICKHAEASLVKAAVYEENGDLIIAVADDGKGIDPQTLRKDSRGVRYMRQRADLIGATLSWQGGEAGHGTIVEIRKTVL